MLQQGIQMVIDGRREGKQIQRMESHFHGISIIQKGAGLNPSLHSIPFNQM
jgi:hypothetical protein